MLVWARKAAPKAPIGKGTRRQGPLALLLGEPVDWFPGFGGLGAASEPSEGDRDRSREQSPLQRPHSHHGKRTRVLSTAIPKASRPRTYLLKFLA